MFYSILGTQPLVVFAYLGGGGGGRGYFLSLISLGRLKVPTQQKSVKTFLGPNRNFSASVN